MASLSARRLTMRPTFRSLVSALRFVSSKVVPSAEMALAGLTLNNITIAVGGFGVAGYPETLINQISRTEGAGNLTLIALDGQPVQQVVEGK